MVFCQLLNAGSFASHKMYTHNQCQQKHFCLKKYIFFASVVIFKNTSHCKGLAMINGAAMPPQLTVKPSQYLSFYQSNDDPALIPSVANMPLDDITISN
jgi:hypothetical protein